jgi:hypothetical protein
MNKEIIGQIILISISILAFSWGIFSIKVAPDMCVESNMLVFWTNETQPQYNAFSMRCESVCVSVSIWDYKNPNMKIENRCDEFMRGTWNGY